MAVSDAPPPRQNASHVVPLRLDIRKVIGLLALYASLVLYEFCHRFMLEHWLSDIYGYFQMYYDKGRPETYFWICILTPITILPAGTKLTNASQIIFSVFMAFVGLPTPLYFVHFVAPAAFPIAYFYFLVCFTLLAIATRIQLPPIPSPFGERGYKRLMWITVAIMIATFVYGMTQDFHLVSFAQLYETRYSEEVNGALVQRVATMYVFSFGSLFLALALMFRRFLYIAAIMVGYVLCYGMIYQKTALLAPLWLIYAYVCARFFVRDSTAKFYLALGAPFYLGVIWYLISPSTASAGANLIQYEYMGTVLFRLYAVTANASGLYYTFFQNHPHTFWSHITGVNFFLRYPYGDHTVAVEMQRAYELGNYNASFLATDAIEAYGYEALPIVALFVAATFIFLNTASRGFSTRALAVLMVMPAFAVVNIPFATTLLTEGIAFLGLYMAWMPRAWLARSHNM